MLVPITLGDSKFVDLLRTVRTCNRKANDACVNKILAVNEEH